MSRAKPGVVDVSSHARQPSNLLTRRQRAASVARRLRSVAACEALEDRQLLSLTVDIRAAGGGKSIQVASVGQVLNLQVWATVSAPNNNPNDYYLEDLTGSFIANGTSSQAVAGNLAAANLSPFTASGKLPGTSVDLNGDGNLDVGSNNNSDISGFFFARAGSPVGVSDGGTIVNSGHSVEFEVGTLTYTVTSLKQGGETDLNFRLRNITLAQGALGAVWSENGTDATNNGTGSVLLGAPYKILDSAITPAPTAVNDSARAVKATAKNINVLSNDIAVGLIDPGTVAIVANATNGNAVVQSDGTITYTSDAGFTGNDTFSYTVHDLNGRVSNAAVVSVDVLAVAPPDAVADVASTPLNSAVDIDVLSNDSASESASLIPSTVAVAGTPAHGTVAVQSNGSILYTPTAGYTGSDSFTYTVADSNNTVSDPAVVNVTVIATPPPTANNDTSAAAPNGAVDVNVLANDTATSPSTLAVNSVAVATPPAHGTAAAQSDGTILYTPAAGYIGADSFSYTVRDTTGQVSNAATVTLTISAGAAPVATDDFAAAVAGVPATINVLANDIPGTGGAALNPASVTVASAPAHGTAVAQSDGTIIFTPAAGFAGNDSFTYTAADANGTVTSPAAVNLNVAVEISNAKGANRSITFVDDSGTSTVVMLNRGVADVAFNGNGAVTIGKGGRATVAGTGLSISNVALSGTTKASVLSVRSKGGSVVLGGVTDADPVGTIIAPAGNLTGTIDVGGLTTLQLQQANTATIQIGAGGAPNVALSLGTVVNTSLTSAAAIRSLKISSWTNTTTNSMAVTAPSIGSLIATGVFEPDVTLSGAMTTARIGTLDKGTWTITGAARSITANAVTAGWSVNVSGLLNALVVKGGLPANVSAGSLGVLNVTGDLTGNVNAGSVKSIHVTGSISGSTITSTGDILSLAAGSLVNSTISAGAGAGITPGIATAGNLGSATIRNIRLTSRSNAFSNSNILAGIITNATLGDVNISNGGIPEGLAATSFKSVSGTFGGTAVHLSAKQLTDNATLAAYLSLKNVTFGDFEIQITT